MAKGKLTAKQRRFIEKYLVDLNATQAAIRAGYSRRTAGQIGEEILKKPEIAAEIEQAMKKRAERNEIEQDDVLQRWWSIATADPNEIVSHRIGACEFCYDGEFDQTGEPNAECLVCRGEGVGRIHIEDTRSLTGKAKALYAGAKKTRYGVEVQLHDQLAALEKVARHLGMFNDKVTLKNDPENPLTLLIQQLQGNAFEPVKSPPKDD